MMEADVLHTHVVGGEWRWKAELRVSWFVELARLFARSPVSFNGGRSLLLAAHIFARMRIACIISW